MKTSKVGLALLLVCCAWAVLIVTGCAKDEVDTTGTIYGIVNDADNGEPVSGVYVVLNPRGKTTNTGSETYFRCCGRAGLRRYGAGAGRVAHQVEYELVGIRQRGDIQNF